MYFKITAAGLSVPSVLEPRTGVFRLKHFRVQILLIISLTLALCLGTPFSISAGNGHQVIPVILYHRVGYTTDPLTVTPQRLASDLAKLKQNGYETISLGTFEDYLAGKDVQLPANPILITFDDSYQDNYDNAFPILRQNGDTATFFIITGLVDKSKDRLTSLEIREMYAAGMSFGSHTVSHTSLGGESKERAWSELLFSKQFLENLLGAPITAIAYPEGSYTLETVRIATEAGYDTGFSVTTGICRWHNPPFIIPRIPVFHYTGDVIDAISRVG